MDNRIAQHPLFFPLPSLTSITTASDSLSYPNYNTPIALAYPEVSPLEL